MRDFFHRRYRPENTWPSRAGPARLKSMKYIILALLLSPLLAFGSHYQIQPGQLHDKGDVEVEVLPDPARYQVVLTYQLHKKAMVPVPDGLLKGKKELELPVEFRTEEGYRKLAQAKKLQIPKAELVFIKRGDFEGLKNAYFLEVLPTNKKSKLHIVYHPSLPATGWKQVTITLFLPLIETYDLVARPAE